MGLIFGPIFLLLLCFAIPGAVLARKAIATSSNKIAELRYLLILVGVFGITEIVGPFLVVHASGKSSVTWDFLLLICFSAFLPAISVGIASCLAFKATAKARYGTVGAAIYLSTALMPFSWGLLGEHLQAAFGLKFLH